MARMGVTGSPVERNNSKVSKEQIMTEDAPPPGGSYSQAIRSGEFLFISGQTPRNLSREIVDGTIEEQAQRAFTNLAKVAEAVSTTWTGYSRGSSRSRGPLEPRFKRISRSRSKSTRCYMPEPNNKDGAECNE